jgi:hypothetical protein
MALILIPESTNLFQESKMQSKHTSKNQPCIRFFRKSLNLAMLTILIAPLSMPVSARSTSNQIDQVTAQQATGNLMAVESDLLEKPRIQLAIILDTSNSMNGLIDQTRNQLWQVVNEFSTARQDGVVPVLEIALFEYGNDRNPAAAGYVRKLNSFTRELDQVSQGLFSLNTSGGSEYSGYAIQTAVRQLQWSRSDTDIKTIFIAGNESFAQGPVHYQQAIQLAIQNGISINTIHVGGHQEGIENGWQAGAILAGGDYMSIDANQQVVHIEAPQDEKIAELNAKLNETYVPYGGEGVEKARLQVEQDALSSGISAGLLAKRAQSKASSFYGNANWDLVDALNDGEVEEAEMVQIKEVDLPEPMRGLTAQQKLEYVQNKAQARSLIKQEISELGRSRALFVSETKRKQDAAAPSMSDALTGAIQKQAEQKNFTFEN